MTPAILLADQQSMISKGLKLLFETEFGCHDVDFVTSGAGVLRLLKRRRHTHLVIDIVLVDGSALEILPVIKNLYSGVKIMVYSGQPPGVYQRVLEKLGICHCLSKRSDELETIRCFGHFLCDSGEEQPRMSTKDSPFATLTARQLEVLYYLLNGKSGVEIAGALNVTKGAVSLLKSQLFERIGVRSIRELMLLAGLYNLI